MKALLFFLPVLAFAQTPSAQPGTIVGVYASYNGHASAGATLAVPVNAKSGIYSYTSYDVILSPGKVPTAAARTGAAMTLRTIGPATLFVLGTAGAATTATATTASFNVGGGLMVSLGSIFVKTKAVQKAYVLIDGGKDTTTSRVVRLGFGWAL